MSNSFIENVNALAAKLDTIISANGIFDENVIPILTEIAALDLDLAVADLKKGNYLGNRKIDINLSYNMTGITDSTDQDIAESIWTDSAKTVLYDSATVTFTDGTVLDIPFTFDGSPTTISTHSDLLLQFNNSAAFLAKLEDTLIAAFAAPVVGEILRLYDVTGTNSNVERIVLHAVSGDYVEQNPTYYWAKTTSSFQTLSMRAGDIIKIGNEVDNLILLANVINELLELKARIPELIDTFTGETPNGDLTVYNKLDELVSIYNNLSRISTVYSNLTPISTVSTNIADVNTTASNISSVSTVASNMTAVTTVNTNISKVSTVSTNIADINSVATNIVPNLTEILQADTNAQLAEDYANKINATVETGTYSSKEYAIGNLTATGGSSKAWAIDTDSPDGTTSKSAKTYASEAAASAAVATTKANEIKAITVGSTITGAAGTNALVTYNSATGQFVFVVPQGIKGDKGDSFTVNAVGLIANRSIYDAQVQGFSFLALDERLIYFKLSSTSGDWSIGSPFGKGDTGDTGDTGNGIASIIFTSTTHVSGLAGQSLGVDTYTITYTDATTDTFTIANGATDHGDLTGLADDDHPQYLNNARGDARYSRLTHTHTKTDVGLGNVDNTSDANKPISTATQTALNSKQSTLVSGTNIKTINGASLLGSGDIIIATDHGNLTGLADDDHTQYHNDARGDARYAKIGKLTPTATSSTDTTMYIPVVGDLSTTEQNVVLDAGLTYNANTNTLTTAISGNASTATTLQTARTINGVSFNGSANITVYDSTKQDILISGTNIKTVHGQSIVGSGDTSYLKATATTLSDTQCYIPFLPALSTDGQLVYLDTLLGFDATKNQLFTNHTAPRVSLTGTAIDLSSGQYFYKTISGATTLTISNPSTSYVNAFVLELINGGSSTVTWFSNITWAGGTAPTLTASGTDIIGFISRDGTNWLGFKMGINMKAGV